MRNRQGIFFSIEIVEDVLRFKLFSFLPWVKVRLDDIEYFRISSKSEYYGCMRAGESVLFWPMMILGYHKRMAPIYVIKRASDGRMFFFRMRSGLHYRLRTAIGNAKTGGHKDNHSPW